MKQSINHNLTNKSRVDVASLVVPSSGIVEISDGTVLSSATIVRFTRPPMSFANSRPVAPSPSTLVALGWRERERERERDTQMTQMMFYFARQKEQ